MNEFESVEVTYPERHAPAEDVDAILHLHKEWWEANVEVDIPRMQAVFPSPGDEYLMYNANRHPYFGMREKTHLWEWLKPLIGRMEGLEVRLMRMEVCGDMAWIGAEIHLKPIQADGGEWTLDSAPGAYYWNTEVYKRDDGGGRPVWKMWHFHSSETAARDEVRHGFDDTAEGRGFGWVPWEPLPVRDEG